MNDGAILRGLRSKNPASLEKLMDKYIPYVSAIVWNFLRASMTKEDAEEVVSDVFLAAWNQAKDIRPNALKPWLGAVARNKARQKLRNAGFDLPLEEDVLDAIRTTGQLSAETEAALKQALEAYTKDFLKSK